MRQVLLIILDICSFTGKYRGYTNNQDDQWKQKFFPDCKVRILSLLSTRVSHTGLGNPVPHHRSGERTYWPAGPSSIIQFEFLGAIIAPPAFTLLGDCHIRFRVWVSLAPHPVVPVRILLLAHRLFDQLTVLCTSRTCPCLP